MIDPTTSLILNLSASPSAYALLLGSGVSTSAGIPTGYQIVEDLIKRLALIAKESPQPNPFDWYQRKFKKPPNYSELLESICPKPEERKALLRGYFEPNVTETNPKLKIPTETHRAIAKLIKRGFFRKIITTNFDRLLERALDEEGITPIVINNQHSASSAPPFHSNECVILKVNGDYLDSTMRNTIQELESYEKPVDKYLDRIFDEYGLIICGWSGEWDHALRNALQRTKNQRFSCFWTHRKSLTTPTKELAESKRAIPIQIDDSDSFFSNLELQIASYLEHTSNHPITKEIASSTTKKFLEDSNVIGLTSYAFRETKKLLGLINSDRYNDRPINDSPQNTITEIKKRLSDYETSTEILLSVISYGCYWGDARYHKLWKSIIESVGQQELPRGTYDKHLNVLKYYPALLLFYAAGISAVANDKYDAVSMLLREIKIHFPQDMNRQFWLHSDITIDAVFRERGMNPQNRYYPGAEYVYEYLKNQLSEIFWQEDKFQLAFDKFDFFSCIVHHELNPHRFLLGPFIYRDYSGGYENLHIENILDKEIEEKKMLWEPFRSGVFNQQKYLEVRSSYFEKLKNHIAQQRF